MKRLGSIPSARVVAVWLIVFSVPYLVGLKVLEAQTPASRETKVGESFSGC